MAVNGSANGARAKIKVVGLGLSGINTLNLIIKEGPFELEFIAACAYSVLLGQSKAKTQILLKENMHEALNASSDACKKGAEGSKDEIANALRGADIVFIVIGLGGSHADMVPVVAKIAKAAGALTIAAVSMPYGFEGQKKAQLAKLSLQGIKDCADAVIVIDGGALIAAAGNNVCIADVFKLLDRALKDTVCAVSDLLAASKNPEAALAEIKNVIGVAAAAYC